LDKEEKKIMLKGIPSILSPQLLKTLMEMGHGDEIVIADGNFPSESIGKNVIRCDGHGTVEILDAILKFFPLDSFSSDQVHLMKVVDGDETKPIIWDKFRETVNKYEPKYNSFGFLERFEFYDRARTAYSIVATGEIALYACIILKKGVVLE